MTMQYVRDAYGVPAKRGGRVMVKLDCGSFEGMEGTITKASHYVHVRLDRYPAQVRRFHPTTLEYIDPPQTGEQEADHE